MKFNKKFKSLLIVLISTVALSACSTTKKSVSKSSGLLSKLDYFFGDLANMKVPSNIYFLYEIHYEKKLTKNIRPTDILQIYTSI